MGECSEAVHSLVEAIASSRAKIADPQKRSKKGLEYTEEGIKSMAVGYIRRKLGIMAVKAQAYSLLGRLESLGPGASGAAARRWKAAEQERVWSHERKAYHISMNQGFNIHRRGFAKLN